MNATNALFPWLNDKNEGNFKVTVCSTYIHKAFFYFIISHKERCCQLSRSKNKLNIYIRNREDWACPVFEDWILDVWSWKQLYYHHELSLGAEGGCRRLEFVPRIWWTSVDYINAPVIGQRRGDCLLQARVGLSRASTSVLGLASHRFSA